MIIRPNDIVRPTTLCTATIRKFRNYHRGKVVAWPHNKVVGVLWAHQLYRGAVPMALRYVEVVKDEDD